MLKTNRYGITECANCQTDYTEASASALARLSFTECSIETCEAELCPDCPVRRCAHCNDPFCEDCADLALTKDADGKPSCADCLTTIAELGRPIIIDPAQLVELGFPHLFTVAPLGVRQ